MAKELNIKEYKDWYKVPRSTFTSSGGKTLLETHGSISKLLQFVYPQEFKKQPRSLPSQHWKDLKNQRNFMDNVAKKLGIMDQEGWYQIKQSGMKSIILIYRFNLNLQILSKWEEADY